jgi:hypothetical protein
MDSLRGTTGSFLRGDGAGSLGSNVSMPLDVDYKVSLRESKTGGRWQINKDKGTITFNLPNHYNSAKKAIERKRGYCNLYDKSDEDIINLFVMDLIETELIERICIERAYQKIRLKGHSRCKPFCVCEKPALCMCYPDAWKEVREYIQEMKAKT